MDMKRIVEVGVALLIAVVFLSSYVANTSYNSQSTTTSIPSTAYAQGVTKVTLTGYDSPLYINVMCSNSTIQNATISLVNSNLTILENNNSVLDFYTTGTNISIATENMTPYNVYSFISAKAGNESASCLKGYSSAQLMLPPVVNVTVSGQKAAIDIPSSYRNTTILSEINTSIGTVLSAKVSMLVTANATIYGPVSIVIIS